MTERSSAPTPTGTGARTGQRRRIAGVDTARGLALLGMMAAHLVPLRAFGEPTPVGLLVEGRASALFAVLAGVGLALADGGSRGPRLPLHTMLARVAVRSVAIVLLGLLVAGLAPPAAIILQYYGLLFLIVAPMLRLPAPMLAGLALVWFALAPAVSHALRAAWDLSGPGPQVDLALLLADPGGSMLTLVLTGYYPVLPWTGYLLVGAVVGRLVLTQRSVALRLCGVGLALALLAPMVSTLLLAAGGSTALAAAPDAVSGRSPGGPLYGTTPTSTWWWLAVDTPHSGTPLDLLGTTGSALLVLGVCLLLTRTAARWPLAPVTAAGSMTLTLYLVHVVALAFDLPPLAGPDTWVIHAATALAVAWLWRSWFSRGPVEQLIAWVVAALAGPAQPPSTSGPGSGSGPAQRASRTA